MYEWEKLIVRVMVVIGVMFLFSSNVSCRSQPNLFYKEGKCPNTTGIIGRCMRSEYNCDSDAECDGPQKCCPYGCLRECLLPGDKVIKCPYWCPQTNDVVCGTDGINYLNPCYLLLTDCTSNYNIAEQYKGACKF